LPRCYAVKLFDLSLNEQEPARSDDLFQSFLAADSLPPVPSLGSIGWAILAQAAVWIACREWPFAPVVLLGIAAATFAWPFLRRIPIVRSVRRAWILIAFVIAFLISTLLIYYRLGGGGDDLVRSAPLRSGSDHPAKGSEGLNGMYDGVILLTDIAPQKLVAPPQLRPSRNLAASKSSDPLSIPFFGVYWMFKWPRSHPPPGSYTSKKSPLQAEFRSSDRGPLLMQARQNFGRLIDLTCCSKIQVGITAQDPYATLDLIVTNTTAAGEPSLSLGQVTINSKSDSPKQMLVNFDVPRDPAVREFDEATIVFNRAYASASARIAIDRFIFVPRRF